MDRITVEDLQANFDEVLDRVVDGESFIIVVDGEDKAILMPHTDYEDMIQEDE